MMDSPIIYYAEVLLPLNLDKSLTYVLPRETAAGDHFGKRVAVELRGALYTGLIVGQTQSPPEGYTPKEIIEILDQEPSVTPAQLRLWQWVAEYYACRLGDVMRAAMPAAMMLESSTRIELAPHNIPENELSDREFLVCEALGNNKNLSVDDISLILQRKNALPAIRKMIGRGLVRVFREYSERYSQKKETVIGLSPEYGQSDEKLKEAFEATSRSEKQRMVLIALLSERAKGNDFVPKKKILEISGEKSAAIDALVKKGVLTIEKRDTDRIKGEAPSKEAKGLSSEQETALQKIHEGFGQGKVVLLHGVTGSGKTEIYARLIRETLEKGRQVLYLLPEIALTTQLVGRMKAYFGEKTGVYHSRYNDMQRAEVWQRVRGNASNRFDLILGARSAVFLPFENLGLVIVDEEHEPSYKQQDPAPRYHGRDTAIYLGKLAGADILLGSATPAIESYHNALNGKFALAELTQRYGAVEMPAISVADIKNAYTSGQMKGHFSLELIEAVRSALENGEQAILFQNRRGYAPVLQCRDCGWVPECRHCDVSLTYHKTSGSLRCHYCGYSETVPATCPCCGSPRLDTKGFGTQQVEDEAEKIFEGARILRMDTDTTSGKNSYQNIIQAFEDRKADILIGTQMIAKGLDFDHVSVVGILNADNVFKNPDFRAFERGYQLLSQVAGRSGRKKKGRVIIQTYEPNHEVIRNVLSSDYAAMYREVLKLRREFLYPPFCRMIRIVLRHKTPQTLDTAANLLAGRMRELFGAGVLGPDYYYIPRINSLFIKHMYIKLPESAPLGWAKEAIRKSAALLTAEKAFRSVRITIDVDPQ